MYDPNCSQAPPGHPVVSLDQFSHSDGDDLERTANLLGLRSIQDRDWSYRPDPFFSGLVLSVAEYPGPVSEGSVVAFCISVVVYYQRHPVRGVYVLSGEWRLLLPNRHSFRAAWLVVLHDLHIRKMVPPQAKYNAAQRIAYSAIMVMGAGSALTGYAIYKPIQFSWLTGLMGGYETARLIHFCLAIGYVLFFVIHIAQVILAGWHNFQSMITGFERKNEPTESQTAA